MPSRRAASSLPTSSRPSSAERELTPFLAEVAATQEPVGGGVGDVEREAGEVGQFADRGRAVVHLHCEREQQAQILERELGLLRPRRYPLPADQVHPTQPGGERFHERIGRSRGGDHLSLSLVARRSGGLAEPVLEAGRADARVSPGVRLCSLNSVPKYRAWTSAITCRGSSLGARDASDDSSSRIGLGTAQLDVPFTRLARPRCRPVRRRRHRPRRAARGRATSGPFRPRCSIRRCGR